MTLTARTTVYCPLYRNDAYRRSQTTGAQVQNIGGSSVNVQFTVNAERPNLRSVQRQHRRG